MMKFRNLAFCLLLTVGLSACSAALVPLSNDPKTKLGQAYQLLYELDRPLPAERLIREAYDIYRERGDEEGMGEAYRFYGFFFVAPATVRWAEIYRQAGFLDGSSYADRFRTSATYFERAAALYTKIGNFDSATSAQYNMADSYRLAGEKDNACLAYDQSLESHRKYMTANPGARVSLPTGYTDYKDLVRDEKARTGCP